MSVATLNNSLPQDFESDDSFEGVAPAPKSAGLFDRLTLNGWILMAAGILVFLSGYSEFRPKIGTVALHPFQFPLLLAMPLTFLLRYHRLPLMPTLTLLSFVGIYLVSTLPGTRAPLDFGEWAKIGSTTLCTLVVAMLVRSRRDFVWGTWGLLIGVAGLATVALLGYQTETGQLQEVLDSGNKNAYSLFALPAIYLAGFVIVRQKQTAFPLKVIFAVMIFVCLLAIFLSANRSGYLGAVLVGAILLLQPSGWEFMGWIVAGLLLWLLQTFTGNAVALGVGMVIGGLRLMWHPRLLGLFVVLTIGAGVFLFMRSYLSTKTVEYRLQQTQEGLGSDRLRAALIKTAVVVCLSNPILGVSPQDVPYYMGDAVQTEFRYNAIDTHNVFAHVGAGSGLLALLVFLATGFLIARWNPYHQPLARLPQGFRDARTLAQGLLFLYLVRGMFTREILYNPGFAIALGLSIGLLVLSADEKPNLLEYEADETDALEEEGAYA